MNLLKFDIDLQVHEKAMDKLISRFKVQQRFQRFFYILVDLEVHQSSRVSIHFLSFLTLYHEGFACFALTWCNNNNNQYSAFYLKIC